MAARPEISVVAPVYRHWALVPGLLAALGAQSLDADRFEILLVDNDPAAGTAPPPLPGNARVLPGTAPGSYAARNAGAASARGALIAFTDADCNPDPDWLEALREAARSRQSRSMRGQTASGVAVSAASP